MWSVNLGAIVAWAVCLASLALPWPGVIICALLCLLFFFEFATSPATWFKNNRPGLNTAGSNMDTRRATGGLVGAAAAAVERLLNWVMRRLHFQLSWEGRGGKLELGKGDRAATAGAVAGARVAKGGEGSGAESNQRTRGHQASRSATFLKGSIGSFSRGGLMVTQEGRVCYKVNQDRGLISHPSLSDAQYTIFGIFDGHGENGEHVASFTMREVPRRLAHHVDALKDPATALKHVFEDINSALPKSGINAVFGGTTAVVALIRGPTIWVANAGDSRAMVAGRKPEGGSIVARALTWDQNPDSPGERERIESMGGFVSDPQEQGASARVWLDPTQTMVGLAMARSIGDLAVKRVGVISEPEITEYELAPTDEFLVLASDGVWEFIDNQEAAEVVNEFLVNGEDAAGACKGLMELANRRWSDMVGDYRDDITATVVRLPFLPPAAAAAAAATAAATSPTRGIPDTAGSAQQVANSVDRLLSNSSRPPADRSAGAVAVPAACAAAAGAAPAAKGSDEGVAPGSQTGSGDGAGAGEDSSWKDSGEEGRIGGGVGMAIGVGAAAAAAALTASGPCSTKAERRLTLPSAVEVRNPSAGAESDSSSGRIDAAKATSGDDNSAAAEEAGAAGIGEQRGLGASAGEHDDGEEAEGRTSSDLTSTPAITPDGSSEEDENDSGGGGATGALAEGHRARRLLTVIAEVFDDEEGAGLSPVSGKLGKVENAEVGASVGSPNTAQDTSAPDLMSENVEIGDESDEMDEDEWELEFGAREQREPSREIREASREFPVASRVSGDGEVDPLATFVSEMEHRRE